MYRATTLAFLIAGAPLALADDAPTQSKPNGDSTAQLLERIHELEQRVAELEAAIRQAPQVTPAPQTPRSHAPIPPRPFGPHQAPEARPFLPPGFPVPPSVGPETERDTVPKSWKPFYFNGQWYYMIPARETPEWTDKTPR